MVATSDKEQQPRDRADKAIAEESQRSNAEQRRKNRKIWPLFIIATVSMLIGPVIGRQLYKEYYNWREERAIADFEKHTVPNYQ
jgi:hypothetical protein